jgi:hypothetical protein
MISSHKAGSPRYCQVRPVWSDVPIARSHLQGHEGPLHSESGRLQLSRAQPPPRRHAGPQAPQTPRAPSRLGAAANCAKRAQGSAAFYSQVVRNTSRRWASARGFKFCRRLKLQNSLWASSPGHRDSGPTTGRPWGEIPLTDAGNKFACLVVCSMRCSMRLFIESAAPRLSRASLPVPGTGRPGCQWESCQSGPSQS